MPELSEKAITGWPERRIVPALGKNLSDSAYLPGWPKACSTPRRHTFFGLYVRGSEAEGIAELIWPPGDESVVNRNN